MAVFTISGLSTPDIGFVNVSNGIWTSGSGFSNGGTNGNILCGLRFRNVPLQQGEVLPPNSVFLTFTATIVNGAAFGRFYGLDADNAPLWSNDFHPGTAYSERTLAYVAITNDNMGSVDLTNIVQEIINRSGWSSGNSISIFGSTLNNFNSPDQFVAPGSVYFQGPIEDFAVSTGSYVSSGFDIDFEYTPYIPEDTIILDSGNYSTTGSDILFSSEKIVNISLDSGQYLLSGSDITIGLVKTEILNSGSYSLSGKSMEFGVNLYSKNIYRKTHGTFPMEYPEGTNELKEIYMINDKPIGPIMGETP